ncbi:uncharacterized protein [Elaeis guineensis]|uniref:Uncharacterized protein LOC105044980 isoform X1 n=1 Tax=Elaeis guineensis var. tenera TaxID=51953 RepID=A0A6I9R6M9_ELAGV|nr:uncharacterized protein LOC105044980 isoform X1 [Elaeis guineensis]
MISSPALIIPLKSFLPPASTSRRAVPFAAAASSSNQPHRIDTEQLRTQLDQLHAEAQITRSKANSARLRLMRLTEAAENLQKRASADVLVGKESKARELLIQKKKLMQALEKSKSRIEVLDKLSAKISEVISLKETQLIQHVAMHSGVSQKDSCQQVRFISPKYGDDEVSNKTNSICTDLTKSGENKVPMTQDCEVNLPGDCQPNFEVCTGIVTSNDDNIISSLKDMSSCKDFLEHVDRQLRVVEIDLVEFIRLQSLKSENREEQMNNKVQEISELLTEILSLRGSRITSIIQSKTNDS